MFAKIVIIALCVTNCFTKFPADIKRCKSGDVECIVQFANEFVRKYPHGREDIGFPQIDPYRAENITVNDHIGPLVNIKLSVKWIETYGLSKINFTRAVGFTKDPNTTKFELYGNVPFLKTIGAYRIEGNIIFLPIEGEGEYEMITEDTLIAYKLKPKVVKVNGRDFIKIQKSKVLVQPKNFKIEIKNLFNGNKKLGDAVNDVINGNWRRIWNEMSSTISRYSGAIIAEDFQRFFSKNEYSDFYLPE